MKMLWLSGLMTTMTMLMMMMVVASVRGYAEGPPLGACTHMFPTGHGVDAMMSDPPYSLVVTGGPLDSVSKKLTVTLRMKSNPEYTYFEGMFVQARMADCYTDKPLGHFELASGEQHLKLLSCDDKTDSAVSHNESVHMDDKTFYWVSPRSEPGHIYFRATVVKNRTTFWTNVFSNVVQDTTHMDTLPTQLCDVCKTKADCGAASSLTSMTSVLLAAIALSLAWLLY